MLRNTIRAVVALGVVGATLVTADQAEAFRRHHRGWGSSGGSWGSHGSSGGWYYGSSGSSGGSWGSSGGSWGSHGSSGGWYYGSSGSSGGSWGSSGGSWGSSGSSGGYHHHHHNSAPQAPAATPAPPTPDAPAPADAGQSAGYHPTYGPMRDSAYLSVKVPADAKVFVNDRPTTSTGTDREYVSHDLNRGARYNYTIRAEFERDGKTVTETKSVQLAAGQSADLDFGAGSAVQTADKDASPSDETRTSLTVRLPADAKLYLAGHETKATGEVREFSTSRLPEGDQWAKYAIRAVVDRNGRQEVREKTVTLRAGESREVTIGFDSLASDEVPKTASR